MTAKHIPMRMCVITRKMLPKSELIRLVVAESGLTIDLTQKKDGRGYWISKDLAVVKDARRRHAFNKILKRNIDDSIYDELEAVVNG